MRLSRREVKTFFLYFISGVTGLSAAVYLSTVLMKPARSQTPEAQAPAAPAPAPTELPPLPDLPSDIPPSGDGAGLPPSQPPTAVPTTPAPSPPAAAVPPEVPAPAPVPVPAQDPNLQLPPAVPPTAPTQAEKQVPSGQLDQSTRTLLEGIIEDFNYEVSGRRDPFLPYTSPKAIALEEEDEVVSPLQRFDLDQLKLIGIIWDTKKPKALFLDPTGKGYIVGKLDKVGRNRGYIAEIREGEVIILERYVGEGRSTFQTRAIRLERE